jgi:hypothetical protein
VRRRGKASTVSNVQEAHPSSSRARTPSGCNDVTMQHKSDRVHPTDPFTLGCLLGAAAATCHAARTRFWHRRAPNSALERAPTVFHPSTGATIVTDGYRAGGSFPRRSGSLGALLRTRERLSASHQQRVRGREQSPKEEARGGVRERQRRGSCFPSRYADGGRGRHSLNLQLTDTSAVAICREVIVLFLKQSGRSLSK